MPFLPQSLTHQVDVRQVNGVNRYAEDTNEFYHRTECLVDQASGRRRGFSNSGIEVSYQYAISFGPDATGLAIGSILEDARDQDNVQIFVKASIEDLRVYRSPLRGIVGYLALANSRE